MSSGYKPSPLGLGTSPRNSPFRRRDSTASHGPPTQSSPLRQTTPISSPIRPSNTEAPPRPEPERTPSATDTVTPSSWTPKPRPSHDDMPKPAPPTSPTRAGPASNTMAAHGNALSQLQPSQVRNLRDGFQILDRDSDGVVNREDVADMLNQLGTSNRP